MKLDLMSLTMNELNQLMAATASAYERKVRGARMNRNGTGTVAEQVLFPLPDAALHADAPRTRK